MNIKRDFRNWQARQIRGTPQPTTAGRVFVVTVIVVAALLYIVNRGNAQDEPVKVCDETATEAFLLALTENLEVFKTDVNAALVGMRGAIDTYQLSCTASVITQVDAPNGIFGPVTFEGTIYQFTIEAPLQEYTYTELKWSTIEGDCDLIQSVSIPGDGGSETDIVEFEDCTALFEVDTNAAAWTVQITKVK